MLNQAFHTDCSKHRNLGFRSEEPHRVYLYSADIGLRPGSAQDIFLSILPKLVFPSVECFQHTSGSVLQCEQHLLALRACVMHPVTSCALQLAKAPSLLYRTDHQNRALESPGEKTANFQPKRFSPCKSYLMLHLLCCVLSYSHPFYFPST